MKVWSSSWPPQNCLLLCSEEVFHSRAFLSAGDSCHIPAADCLQSYPKCPALCNDFSRQLTGLLARVTPQILPDNTLRHSSWSHSPDLAAPANWGEEGRKTFLLISSLCWEKRDSVAHSLSVAPIDFEPFVLLGPWIASLGLPKSCTQRLPMQFAIMNWRNVCNLSKMWQIHLLYLAECCHVGTYVLFCRTNCICHWRLTKSGSCST